MTEIKQFDAEQQSQRRDTMNKKINAEGRAEGGLSSHKSTPTVLSQFPVWASSSNHKHSVTQCETLKAQQL